MNLAWIESLYLLELNHLGNVEDKCVATYQGQADPLSLPGDGRKCEEPWGCSTYLYSQVGEPRTLQAACLTSERPLLV